ncbi:hypothetical protein [Wenxinia saemankumensis]|uniref:Uncharacterized protein n=1 Tax=Wenxinia saemankumensis TaxID=1447782 RepID=A0A1M6AG99_9RHOB|nr:hypothetical protein [Wenxinia saemankumensis]SHI35338.1 hypothetical protein SAMN05444417_0411 [Wenxinia saemankumensis]
MKTLTTLALLALGAAAPLAPAHAAIHGPAFAIDGPVAEFDRRGRGRGRDDTHVEDRRRDDRSDDRGRRRPRVPGGSGCDDARDILEHPECRV